MKISYLKNYNQFIYLIWVVFGLILCLIYISYSTVSEGCLLALSVLVCAYPFTTYLSRNLLQKAIRRKNMQLFVGQFILITALSAMFIPFILYGFLLLEKTGFFHSSELVINENSFVREYLNAFLVTLLVNFGFCGLRFYEINLQEQLAPQLESTILIKQNKESETSDLYVRQGDTFRKISRENILYVEGMQNYLKLCLKEEVIIIHQTMISLEEMLPKELFFRIHRSYLINLSHIDSISGGRIIIAGKELPLASARKDELLKTVVYKKLISK